MYYDTGLGNGSLREVAQLVRKAEAVGFDALWMPELTANPLLALAIVATESTYARFGPSIALAFVRSPMVMAMDAWQLAEASQGRFILGLGTQVKTHNERRYSVPFEHPGPKLREQVLALRHIFGAFQEEHELNFKGEFYRFDYITPLMKPKPIAHPRIPIWIAAVGEYMCKVAGEVCDGMHVHPFHTIKYLKEVVRPAVEQGATSAGRDWASFTFSSSVFAITGHTAEERAREKAVVKQQIGFYGATRSYEPVFLTHGWEGLTAKLQAQVKAGDWSQLMNTISDEVVDAFAITCEWDELPEALAARYNGLLDRVSLYHSPSRGWQDYPQEWSSMINRLHKLTAQS